MQATAIQNNLVRVTVKGFLTAAEVAKRFNVTSKTVTRWIDDGDLPGASKINPSLANSPYLIPVEAVDALFEKRISETSENQSGNGNKSL